MRKFLVVGAILLLALFVCLTPMQTIWDDGLWPLYVTIDSTSGTPIASVSCEAFSSEQSAQHSLEHLAPPETRTHSVVVNPLRGEPVDVPIPTSYKIRRAILGVILGTIKCGSWSLSSTIQTADETGAWWKCQIFGMHVHCASKFRD